MLATGERPGQPGLVRALELVAEEEPKPSLHAALLELMDERGGLVTEHGPSRLRGPVDEARERPVQGSHPPESKRLEQPAARAGALAGSNPVTIALALRGPDSNGDTTNLGVVDRDGNAVVLTTCPGLGSGDWPRASTCI